MNKFTCWFCLFVPARILLSTLDLLSFILFSQQDETRFALWLSEYAMVFLALAVGLKAPALAVPNYSRMENDAENPSTNVSSCILVMTACAIGHNGLMESRSQFLAWVWIVSNLGIFSMETEMEKTILLIFRQVWLQNGRQMIYICNICIGLLFHQTWSRWSMEIGTFRS